MSEIIATHVKDLDGFTGEASLYRLNTSIEYDEPSKTTDHVVISATVAMFSGPETYIFPADEYGEIVDWGEMEGSYRGGLSHQRAITNAGWTLAKG